MTYRFRMKFHCLALVATILLSAETFAQSVCLPAPRLLTTMPMGGQVGTTVEVRITAENAENVDELHFSHPGITATPKLGPDGLPLENQFVVAIANDCPLGIHDARVMTRLGVSSSRAFNISALPEAACVTKNTTLETAMPLPLNVICNAAMTKQAVDYYAFEAQQGQRVVVDCAAKGIDSKLTPVLIVADAAGNDLVVERRGGAIDFVVPIDGHYVVKVHDLTFDGGPYYFYRLAIQSAATDELIARLPSTKAVNSFSWPPHDLTDDMVVAEVEPNNAGSETQQITLPCDIAGSFYPAADVDSFEFTAKKGETWWVEVASERLGLSTDPAIVVQQVTGTAADQQLTDLVELTDIPSPIKVSSNGYSYDGPPYNVGTSDIIGKIEIETDGVYRLQLSDLFGGTRNDPSNIYRLIIRKASPDFAVVGWALHMGLRNGDRNALSKPVSLRGGATMAIEVLAVRRDGFDGEINLVLENLPEGVTATGLKIDKGQHRGTILISADQNAPRGLTNARFLAKAVINEQEVTRPGYLASMKWPVPNAKSEIPDPRLLADLPVGVCGNEVAPLTIAAAEEKVWEVVAGEKLTIPLVHTRRCDLSGKKISLKTFGSGFEKNAAFDAPLDQETSEAVIDLAKLKTPPGDYTIAFYGSAVAKYQYHAAAVAAAEDVLQAATEKAAVIVAEAKVAADAAKDVTAEQKLALEAESKTEAEKQKAAQAAVASADQALKAAVATARPKDIVDIVVSRPITIRVTAAPADQEAPPK